MAADKDVRVLKRKYDHDRCLDRVFYDIVESGKEPSITFEEACQQCDAEREAK